jgi:uncharacterized cupredoxin-like copper-binding protein
VKPRDELDRRAIVGVVALVLALAAASTIGVAALGGGIGPHRPNRFAAITCSDPQLPAPLVRVTLSDAGSGMMGPIPMMADLRAGPHSVPAGRISFLIHNRGGLVHEMLVLPLPADGPGTRSVNSDGKVDESPSLGEAPRSCAQGSGDGVAPGSKSWVTLNLQPGRYELICNEPWHYPAGMFDVLTVR